MEKKSNSELKREFSEKKKEFDKRQDIEKAQLEKAKELKPEFDKLDYPGKIKFMEEHFEGIPGIGDKGKRLLSIYPDETNPEQIRLFNEAFIKRWERNEGEIFIEYSFDRLKARFFAHIDKIHETNDVPDDLIREYIEKEIRTYSERVKTPFIQSERDFYNGNWDLSKRVIQTSYLIAQAYYNYLPFLKDQLTKGKDQLNKGVTRGRGKKTFPEYFINLPEEKKTWFADQLKKEFKNINGKPLRHLLEALKHMGIIENWAKNREGQKLYDAIQDYFGYKLASKWYVTGEGTITISDEPGRKNDKPNIELAAKRIQLIIDQINKG